MASLQLGPYSPVNFRPHVADGKVTSFSGCAFLCAECARELGADEAESGQISNIHWHSKGYDVCGSRKCLCGREIEDGTEVWLTIKTS